MLTKSNTELETRVATLEQAARPRRDRLAAPRPANADMDERDGWWADYLRAEMMCGRGTVKLTKAAFATAHGIPLSEFYRTFSRHDRRGIPKGSSPYLRVRAELLGATAKLRDSHGTGRTSHIIPMKAAVTSLHDRDGGATAADRG